MKLYLQIFFIDRKDLIETQHVEDAERERIHNSKKEILTANLFIHDLITFSISIDLKNIFASKQRSHEILIISE